MLDKMFVFSEKLIFLYFCLLLFLGIPFSKFLIIENLYLFLFFIFYLIIISILKILIHGSIKELFDIFTLVYLITIIFLLFKLRFEENDLSFQLKVGFVLIIPLIAKSIRVIQSDFSFIIKIFTIKLNKYQNLIFVYFFILTLVGRSGSYGMLYISTSFIDGNLLNFIPQSITLSLFIILFLLKFKINLLSQILLSLNLVLLASINRSSILVIVLLVVMIIKKKKYNLLRNILIFSFIFIFSNALDEIGYYANNKLIDEGGKEHLYLACQRYYDDEINLDGKDVKNTNFKNLYYESYDNRDVALGTLPKYFSGSSFFQYLGVDLNFKRYLTLGKTNICEENYFIYQKNESKSKSLNSVKNKFIGNQNSANLNFRFSLWKSILNNVNTENIFIGNLINKNILYEYSEYISIDIGLWHAHNSYFTIFGYFGFFGLALFSLLNIFIGINKEIKIIIFSFFLLAIFDGIFENPYFSILYWTLIGITSTEEDVK